jgi:hypothetical protein
MYYVVSELTSWGIMQKSVVSARWNCIYSSFTFTVGLKVNSSTKNSQTGELFEVLQHPLANVMVCTHSRLDYT